MRADGMLTSTLAHQGGWDELLLVGAPILVIVVLLAIAKRRVDAVAAATPVDAEAEAEIDGTG